MEAISIIYKDLESDDLLGQETHQGISEVLFPDIDFYKNPITITKQFADKAYHRWIVKKVEHKEKSIIIFLSPRTSCADEEFLRKTYKNHSNVLSNLTIGTFVEVDFGYILSTKKLSGNFGSIKRYPDLVNNGEMHKRRLCIVVKACSDHVQVIPISSQPQNTLNKSICLISHDSLKDLVDYNKPQIDSYSLCHMVEAVSLNRVLPPKSKNRGGVYRNNKYIKRLNKTDLKKLNLSLASGVSLIDYVKVKEQNTINYKEKIELNKKIQINNDSIEELTRNNIELKKQLETYEAMKYLLEDFYNGLGKTPSDVQSDIKEIQAILSTE